MSAEISASMQFTHVACSDDALTVDLADGRRISVPLAWFPRLLHATQAQRLAHARTNTPRRLSTARFIA